MTDHVDAAKTLPVASTLPVAFEVVGGAPTDEEIAALVAVFSAASAAAVQTPESTRPPELWGSPVAMHRVAAPFSPYSFVHLG